MTNKCLENESPLTALTSDAARQRWEMFHRAIAYAKQSNFDALQEDEIVIPEHDQASPVLSIIR